MQRTNTNLTTLLLGFRAFNLLESRQLDSRLSHLHVTIAWPYTTKQPFALHIPPTSLAKLPLAGSVPWSWSAALSITGRGGLDETGGATARAGPSPAQSYLRVQQLTPSFHPGSEDASCEHCQ